MQIKYTTQYLLFAGVFIWKQELTLPQPWSSCLHFWVLSLQVFTTTPSLRGPGKHCINLAALTWLVHVTLVVLGYQKRQMPVSLALREGRGRRSVKSSRPAWFPLRTAIKPGIKSQTQSQTNSKAKSTAQSKSIRAQGLVVNQASICICPTCILLCTVDHV